jgi:tagatose 6-phosphate kinase
MSYVLAVGLNPALQKALTFSKYVTQGVNRASSVTNLASGKGINVARTLTLLGHKSITTGLLGGPNGFIIESELKKEGIHTAFTSIECNTRQCMTIIDLGRETTTELIEPSPVVTPGELNRWVHAYESLVPWCSHVSISGTAPTGIPSILYKRLIAFAHNHGKPVLLDCGGELWRIGAESEPEVLKSNEDEFWDATQSRHGSEQLIQHASPHIRGKIKWIVITRGPENTLFLTKDSAYWASPPKIKAINPIGSGDAFAAGMIAAMLQGMDNESIIRFAVSCGTANALISGPGIVRPADVKRLLTEVKIKRVAL